MSDLFLGMGVGLLVKGEVYKFLVTVLGAGAEGAAEYIKNEVRCFNSQRVSDTICKNYETFKAAGIEPQAVAYKTLIPLLEGISLEDDENLQEWWTKLLESAIEKGILPSSYPSIMRDLDPIDAQILEMMFQENKSLEQVKKDAKGDDSILMNKIIGFDRETLINRLQTDTESVEVSIGNLFRLNLCVEKHFSFDGELNPDPALDNRILLTPLGSAFMRAVKGVAQLA